MKRVYLIFSLAAVLGTTVTATALLNSNAVSAEPLGESPELGRTGDQAVGTQVQEFTLPDRVRITLTGAVTGNLPVEVRRVQVRLWYPATADAKLPRIRYDHLVSVGGKPGFMVSTQGIAAQGAVPVAGKRFPLVLISHGYGGWGTSMSNLGETLASKGYVVAAIDHADMPFDSGRTFLLSFGNVILDRAQDQRQILALILKQAATAKTGYAAAIDTAQVGLIGYSMGGFGALATAGAPYDLASKTISQLPKSAQAAVMGGAADMAGKVKALVLLAPWGGQPDNRSWNAAGLGQIKMPVLMMAGDHDDIVDFRHGASWIFDHLTGADRSLLVYREARHNIANNPVPGTAASDFQSLEYFAEPVWRTERINAINQHFITAFFDLTLKGDKGKAAFLAVPQEIAGDGEWPTSFGEQLGGKLAGSDQPNYWRGFQRRWALGLEMHRAGKGAAGTMEAAGK